MKNKNNNETYKIVLTVIAVLLLIVLVGGGTFAWWTWRSATNTTVSITVSGGTYTLNGGGNITAQNLVPTDQCNGTYAIKRTIVATNTNSTNSAMTASVQLNPTTFPTQLKSTYIKWAVTTSSSSCTTGVVKSGNFSTVTQGTPFEIASFTVPANTTTEKETTYYLYIWLDSTYSSQNIGNTVNDPMQDKSFTLSLTGSMTNQPA